MTSKTVYLRDELLAIAAAVRDVKPTADEEATYAVIQEGEPRFAAASAPSASVPTAPSKGNRVERQQHGSAAAGAAPPAAAKDPMAALNARFSADRKWDKEDATSSVLRGGGRGGSSRVGGTDAARGGVPAGAGSGGAWRGGGGGRDRETFEEGYLYELKQNAKHKQVLQSTVEKYEALRQKEEDDVKKSELAAELDAEASRPGAVIATAPGAIDELDAMFSRLRAKEGGDEEADLGLNLVPAAVENNEVTKKRSRFFSGPAESADVPPSVPQPAAAAVSHVDPFIPPVVTPIATEELLLAPSSNVVWNRKPVDAAQPQLQQPPKPQVPAKQQQQQLATPSNAANAKPAQQQPPGRSGGKGEQQRGGKQVAKESAPTEAVPNRVAASPSTTTNLSTVSSLSALSKITVGVQNQPPAPKGKNQRVWSAADLESKLLGQQPQEPQSVSGKPSAAKVTTAAVAPAKTNMGVFDASDLESQLLGSKPAGSGVQVGQPLSSPLPRSQQLQQQQQLVQPTTHSPPVAISTSAAPPSPAVPPQQATPAPININVASIGLPGGRPPAVIPAAVAPLPSPSMPPSAPQSTPAALPTLGQPQHQQPPTMLLPNGQQAVQLQYAQYVLAAQQRQGIQVPGVMVNPAMGGRPMQPLSASPASQGGQWVVQQPAAQPTAGQQQAPTAMRTVMPMQQSGQSMPMRQHVMGGFPTAQQPAAYGGMFTHQAPTTIGGGIPMQQSAAIHHQFAMLYGQQQAQAQPQTQRAAPQQQQQQQQR